MGAADPREIVIYRDMLIRIKHRAYLTAADADATIFKAVAALKGRIALRPQIITKIRQGAIKNESI